MQMPDFKRLILAASAIILAVCGDPVAMADPWARPGDLALRHDIQLLADAGLIKAPVNTWPMPWGDAWPTTWPCGQSAPADALAGGA
jgi:hypothetical protein